MHNIPVGRHDLRAMFVGYEPAVSREILLTSAKGVYLEIRMKKSVYVLLLLFVVFLVHLEKIVSSKDIPSCYFFAPIQVAFFHNHSNGPWL